MAMGASVNTFNQPEALWLLLSIPLYLWLSRRSELLKRKAFTGAFLLDTSRRNETGHLWRAMNLEALMTSLWLLSVVLLVAQPRGCSQTSVLLTDGPVPDVVAQEFEHIYRVGASRTLWMTTAKSHLSMDRVIGNMRGQRSPRSFRVQLFHNFCQKIASRRGWRRCATSRRTVVSRCTGRCGRRS